MGGSGSGRHWHWNAKATTDSMIKLDVRRLAREGYLSPGQRYGWNWWENGECTSHIQIETHEASITLDYRARSRGEDWEHLRYPVHILSQPCNLGGERQWFACPARGCDNRVAILYGGRIFACRTCYGLAYASQSETNFQRYQRRASRIKARLGWDTSPSGLWGQRPKGMHRKTFRRLIEELDHWDHASDTAFAQFFLARHEYLNDRKKSVTAPQRVGNKVD